MNIVKRVFGDFIGCFELIFITLFKYNKGLLMFLVSPFLIPIYCLWTIIKINYHIFKMPSLFTAGKVFMWGSAITGVLAVILSVFFPDIYGRLCMFEPVSTAGMVAWFSNLSGTAEGLFDNVLNGNTSVLAIILWLFILPLFVCILILSYGAVHVPLFAYIWVIMFFAMIIGLISDTASLGRRGAIVETGRLIWEYDIRFGLFTVLSGCVEFPINCLLYCTPILNVIIYRHRLKLDKRERNYPPIDSSGAVDTDKLSRMHNAVYSRFIV